MCSSKARSPAPGAPVACWRSLPCASIDGAVHYADLDMHRGAKVKAELHTLEAIAELIPLPRYQPPSPPRSLKRSLRHSLLLVSAHCRPSALPPLMQLSESQLSSPMRRRLLALSGRSKDFDVVPQSDGSGKALPCRRSLFTTRHEMKLSRRSLLLAAAFAPQAFARSSEAGQAMTPNFWNQPRWVWLKRQGN